MRWLDGITDSIDVSLSELREIGRASCRGKSVDLGGRRIIKKKKKKIYLLFYYFLSLYVMFIFFSIYLVIFKLPISLDSIIYSFKSRISIIFFFFSSRRRHTRLSGDWSSDVCSSDLAKDDTQAQKEEAARHEDRQPTPGRQLR